jgi:carbamoyl-phosphate synthase large subunit
MEIVHDEADLRRYIRTAVEASPERPVLVDRFLEDATEVMWIASPDGEICVIGGVMEHIEVADSLRRQRPAVIPSFSLSPQV